MDNSSPIPVPQSSDIPAQPSPSLSPPSPPSAKSPFLFILGGIALLTIILTGGIFLSKNLSSSKTSPPPVSPTSTLSPASFLSPTPLPTSDLYTESSRSATANWNTYTSTKGQFSFRYPPSYVINDKTNDIFIQEKKEDKHPSITLLQPTLPRTGFDENDDSLGIEISIDTITGNKTVQEYTDEQIRSTRESAGVFEVSNKTNINIDGVEGVRYLWNQHEGMDGSGENVEFIYKAKAIHVLKLPQKTSQQYIFDQILSTFKFLDSSVSVNPTLPPSSSQTAAKPECAKDADCPNGYFCDYGTSCSLPDPSGKSSCGEEGSGTCVKSCNTDTDCTGAKKCQYFSIPNGDAYFLKKGCR